jgi:phosphoglycerate kinase
VVLLAHFDRPKGKRVPEMSLKFLAEPLSQAAGAAGGLRRRLRGPEAAAAIDGMENGRRRPAGERPLPRRRREERPGVRRGQLAANGDLYVNDAFSRRPPGPRLDRGPGAAAAGLSGLSMQRELEALDAALGNPQRPVMGIVGGSKVSTKLDLLNNLVDQARQAGDRRRHGQHLPLRPGPRRRRLLCEKDLADTAREIIEKAKAAGCKLLLPSTWSWPRGHGSPGAPRPCADGVHRPTTASSTPARRAPSACWPPWTQLQTLIWNGPLGVFEVPPFDEGDRFGGQTRRAARESGKLVAVAGGGDTVAALNHAGVSADFTFVSTAGGAFLEWMEGKTLPGGREAGADLQIRVQPVSDWLSGQRTHKRGPRTQSPFDYVARITLRQLLDHAAEHELRRAGLQHQQHGAGPGDHGGGRRGRRAGHHPGFSAARAPTPTTSCWKHLIDALTEIYPHIPSACTRTTATSPATCATAIQYGFTSVMMDGSLMADAKTPATTTTTSTSPATWSTWPTGGVSVEGELGVLGSLETGMGEKEDGHGFEGKLSHDQLLTDPDQAVDFVKATKVDALAIAMGTSHGAYKFTRKPDGDVLAMNVIEEIHRRCPTPTW